MPRESATSSAQLLAALQESVDRAKAILGAMDDADLAAPSRITCGERVLLEMPRGTFLRTVLFNHWYHHRGQLTVYLRLLDTPVPAVYGNSADDPGPLG